MSSKGFDFVHIPGAEIGTGTMIGKQIGSNICGQNVGIITMSSAMTTTLNKSVCCKYDIREYYSNLNSKALISNLAIMIL